ncbi:MAG TPA: diacylglycerol kinase family protein [Candidatus Limnocylindria bacterium]|nr:diacylglycerol kinase family protein [Candidatus Limnocylindria bacterium]
METRHVYILNPKAGTHDARARLEAQLQALSPQPYTLYITSGPGDAAKFAAQVCAEDKSPLRLYACGGDGTLGEVAQGALGFAHVSVAAWPCGSGNDFVKMYGGAQRFVDLSRQSDAPAVPVDVIRVDGHASINVVNVGLEAYAAAAVAKIRYSPVLGGKRAYYIGAAQAALANTHVDCEITADGNVLHSGPLMTASFASGKYIGGGFLCAPNAVNDDGLMEVTAIRPLTRVGIARLIGIYKRGDHLTHPAFKPYVAYARARRVHISCAQETDWCLDGEIVRGRGFDLEVLPGAIRFVVPPPAAGAD